MFKKIQIVFLVVFFVVAVLLFIVWSYFKYSHRGKPARIVPDHQVTLLIALPVILDLGILPQRTVGRGTIQLRNPGSEPVDIAKLVTSCPCVRFLTNSIRVGPGEERRVEVLFDPAEEPDFLGSLSVECRGETEDGVTAFQSKVDIRIERTISPIK